MDNTQKIASGDNQEPPFSMRLVFGCLLGCLAVGALLRLWAIDFPASGRFRPDEEYLVSRALGFHSGDLNPHLFNYPTFYMYCLSAIFLIWKSLLAVINGFNFENLMTFGEMAEFHLLARAATAVIGIAGIIVVYLLGKEAFGRKVGLISAVFTTFCFIHIRDSHFATVDVPMTLMAALCCIHIIRAAERGWWRDYLIAAVFGGFAVSTKYTALALGIPFAAAHLLRLIKERSMPWQKESLLKCFSAILLLLGCALAASPYILLDYQSFSSSIAMVYQFARDGLAGVHQARGWNWILIFCMQKSFGWALMCLFYASLAAVFLKLRRRRYESGEIILALFACVLLIIYARANWSPIRYMVLLVPSVCILSAALLVRIFGRLPVACGNLLLLAAVILICLEPFSRAVAFNRLLSKPDTRVLAKAWLEKEAAAGSRSIGVTGFFYGKPELPAGYSYRILDQPDLTRLEIPDYILEDKHPIFFFSRGLSNYYKKLAAAEYRLAFESDPFYRGSGAGAAFDLSDAFYMPLDGFEFVRQPGPRIRIYKRN